MPCNQSLKNHKEKSVLLFRLFTCANDGRDGFSLFYVVENQPLKGVESSQNWQESTCARVSFL